jgi:hypothetical protein
MWGWKLMGSGGATLPGAGSAPTKRKVEAKARHFLRKLRGVATWPPVRRDPDRSSFRRFPKLSRNSLSVLTIKAQRTGSKGSAALAVLQDALQEQYPEELNASIRRAKGRAKKSGRVQAVIFFTSLERDITKAKHAIDVQTATNSPLIFNKRYLSENKNAVLWRKRARHPFFVTNNPFTRMKTKGSIVVWDTDDQWNVHGWVSKKKFLTQNERVTLAYAQAFGVVAYGNVLPAVYSQDRQINERVSLASLDSLVKKNLIRSSGRSGVPGVAPSLAAMHLRYLLTSKGARIARKISQEGIGEGPRTVRDKNKRRLTRKRRTTKRSSRFLKRRR